MNKRRYQFMETHSVGIRKYIDNKTGKYVYTGTGEEDIYNFNGETVQVEE